MRRRRVLSVGYATAFIGFFYLLTFILGFGAMVIVGRKAITKVNAGGNMAAPLLAEVVGGTPFLGFIAAVAFATILAVVAGLTLSGAATLSHDLWVNVIRGAHASKRKQFLVARGATILLAIVSIILGITFKGQNVAYMVGLASAIADSANFPALVLSIFWKRLTTAGAQVSMITETLSRLRVDYSCGTIQLDILKTAKLVPVTIGDRTIRSVQREREKVLIGTQRRQGKQRSPGPKRPGVKPREQTEK